MFSKTHARAKLPSELAAGPNLPQSVAQHADVSTVEPQLNALTPPSALASASHTAEGSEQQLQLLTDDGALSGVVVHLLAVRDVPRLRHLSRARVSPFVRARVIDGNGVYVGTEVEWVPRNATRQPVWNVARDLRVPPMSPADVQASRLHVEVWDYSGGLLPCAVYSTQTCRG